MSNILVIQENGTSIIGVASSKESVIKMILEYFGKKSHISHIRDVEDSGIEFTCVVTEPDGFQSGIAVHYFDIDKI